NALALLSRFLHVLFVDRGNFGVEMRQAVLNFLQLRERGIALFPGAGQVALDVFTARAKRFTGAAAQKENHDRNKNGEVRELPQLKTRIVPPVFFRQRDECKESQQHWINSNSIAPPAA